MKRCPTCNLTFEEDWLSFCTQDGTTLFDDAVTPIRPPPTVLAPAQPDAPAWNTRSAEVPLSSPEWRPPSQRVQEWQPPPPPAYFQAQSKSLATASMILGIISVTMGWLCFGPVLGIAAIITGAVALSQIKKTPNFVGGKQMAWIGLVSGSVAVLGTILLYVFIIVAGNL